MGKKDPRVDAYIAKAAPFARPILNHVRKLVHAACPEVEETLKWGLPSFQYKGALCEMAAFKAHCAIPFRKAELIAAIDKTFVERAGEGMGHLGKITSKADLPPDRLLTKWIKLSAKFNDEGIKPPSRTRANPPRPLDIPDYFITALKKNKKALATFESFSLSKKRDYVEWVTGAKREETRSQRMRQSIEWLAEGKPLNWRYESK